MRSQIDHTVLRIIVGAPLGATTGSLYGRLAPANSWNSSVELWSAASER